MDEVDTFLEHHGVKGMHWGVRRQRLDRVSRVQAGTASRKTQKEAKKDAEEFARAKMFYGQGAGTRRKLINKSVESKKKRDPAYAKAFDEALSNQDLSTHATAAQKERHSVDRKDRTKKRAGYVARKFTGEMGTQAAFTAAALAGAAYASSPKGKQHMKTGYHKVKGFAGNIHGEAMRRKGAAHINKLLKNMA